jgi:hypothetical protein
MVSRVQALWTGKRAQTGRPDFWTLQFRRRKHFIFTIFVQFILAKFQAQYIHAFEGSNLESFRPNFVFENPDKILSIFF